MPDVEISPEELPVIYIDDIRQEQKMWEAGVGGASSFLGRLTEGNWDMEQLTAISEEMGPLRCANYMERLGDISIDRGGEPSLVDRIRAFGHNIIENFIR